MRQMMLAFLGLLTQDIALAGPEWFLRPPEIQFSKVVDVPLYRGEVGAHRPMIYATFPDDPASSTLAIVDLGGEWTRVGVDLAVELGLTVQTARRHGRTVKRTVIDEVAIGDLTLHGLRAEVVDGNELILGLGAAGPIGIGILPSAGVVRFAPPDGVDALLDAAGGAIPTSGQDTSSWREHGERRWGNGLSLSSSVGIDGREVSTWLRTDWSQTRLLEDAAEVALAGRTLSLTPLRDGSLGDPRPDFVGGLGYDVLFAYDLALAPERERMAMTYVSEPKWHDPGPIRAAAATLRHALWLASAEGRPGGSEAGPRIGFAVTDGTPEPAADLPDPMAAAQHAALADALWMAGDADGAVRASLAASRAGSDRCDLHMVLGVRRRRVSGALQSQDFVGRLVRDPLEKAAALWDDWSSLSTTERQALRGDGTLQPPGTPSPQAESCREAWGQVGLSLLAQGLIASVIALEGKGHDRDQQLALARGIALRLAGDPGASEAVIRGAMGGGARDNAPVRFAYAAARHDQRKPMPKLRVDGDRPDAMVLALSARQLGVAAGGDSIPDQLAGAVYGLTEVAELADAIAWARARRSGAPSVACQEAVFHALMGDVEAASAALRTAASARHRVPDYWLARYFVAMAAWDLPKAREALAELRMRFPELPVEIAR